MSDVVGFVVTKRKRKSEIGMDERTDLVGWWTIQFVVRNVFVDLLSWCSSSDWKQTRFSSDFRAKRAAYQSGRAAASKGLAKAIDGNIN